MNKESIRGTQAWVDKISQHELPALAATVRNLETLASKQTASLPSLGKSILHDQGLTTRILRVVNSVCYRRGRNQVTTVSRAAVILGYDALKHICITAKMIDSMLRNRDINEHVYDRLLRLMAKAFHSAMLAKTLVADHTEDTQEEVYIAALLHELGEIAFWSINDEITRQFDIALREGTDSKEVLEERLLGTSFSKLSVGLAGSWNMGEMLVRSIEDPGSRTPELRAISLASEYSEALTNPDADINIKACFDEMSELIKTPINQLKRKLKHCTEEAVELAVSYGAKSLTDYIDPNADLSRFERQEPEHKSDEMVQLKLLRELTQLASEHADINLMINTAIEGLHRGVGLDRVIVFMVNQQRDKLKPRFVSCQEAEQIENDFVILLTASKTIFNDVFERQIPQWIKDPNDREWRQKLTPAIHLLSQYLPFFASPLVVGGKSIGVVYADRSETKRELTQADFTSFNHFSGQLSLCLSFAIK